GAGNRADRANPSGRRRRRSRGAVLVSWALVAALLVHATGVHAALPAGGAIQSGAGEIVQHGEDLIVVDQWSDRLIVHWDSFSIGPAKQVEFVQPGASAVALNRVFGDSPSLIDGVLRANGQVFLVNPNGVVFGKDASVDVGGVVASTLSIAGDDFLVGRYRFTGGDAAGEVRNEGAITALEGGYVALLGTRVQNEGVIRADLGAVALGAGEAATLGFADGRLIGLEVDAGAWDALVANHGVLEADGGLVVMRAEAQEALFDTVLHHSGVARARSVEMHDGVVILGGGESGVVEVSGVIDVSGAGGGSEGPGGD